MTRIACLILLLFVLLGCDNDKEPIDFDLIELQPFIIDNYYEDAKQLYFNEIIHDPSHPNYNDPILDNSEIEKILKIIQAVYDLGSPERDIVFDKYQIHGYYCYGFSSISLKVDPNQPEIVNLSNGIFQTGEASLDNILKKYHFNTVETSYSYPDFPWLTIATPDEYNMIPIEKELAGIGSIVLAEFNKSCIGDGSNISLKRGNTSAIITFSIGSGDCPSGCIYHTYWEFKVTNGSAAFVRTYED